MHQGGQVKPYFEDGSPYLSDSSFTTERTAAEIDEVMRRTETSSGRVLDIGCGFGRHAIELASRGCDVTGLDVSRTMVDAARSKAIEANQFADFVCVAAQDFTEVARYDLAVCLFSSLGQQRINRRNDEPHLALLHNAKRTLRPGGHLVVEVFDRDRVVPQLPKTEHLGWAKVVRTFDQRESTITELCKLAMSDTYRQVYRVFDRTELVDLMHDAGFVVRDVHDGGLIEASNTMMTLVAQRPS